MASAARIAASIRNAQKSTGPKTTEGKRKSRTNAIKHGLTAKTVLLPEEDPAEFKQLMEGWFDAKKPQDQSEASLVEGAAYSLWQLHRVNRAQSALLWLRADGHADDEAHRVEQEVDELARVLFRPPNGRPTALPCAHSAGADPEGSNAQSGTFEMEVHPSKVIGRLTSTALGCRWLLEFWSELRSSLEKAGWNAAERFRAFRLLGIHPSTTYMNAELASIIQACQVIDPDAGSLAGEVWYELVPKDALPALEAMYQREVAHLPAIDLDGARKCLLLRIELETSLIEEKLHRHEERAEAGQELVFHQHAFDNSREGRLLHRYEHSCKQFFLRCLDELRDHRDERADQAKQGIRGWYIRPRAEWFSLEAKTEMRRPAPASINSEIGMLAHASTKSEILISKGETETESEVEEVVRSGEGVGLQVGAPSEGELAEWTAMEHAGLAEGARTWVPQRAGRVAELASAEATLATNTQTLSNKERKRRRREERQRMRDLLALRNPLSIV
jgi:hypothetical protein